MKDRKTKTALKVVHRNDRAQVERVLAGSGQALLPMLELLEGAQASIDELMHDAAVAVVEQLLGKRVTEALWKPNHCMSTIADRARQGMVCT